MIPAQVNRTFNSSRSRPLTSAASNRASRIARTRGAFPLIALAVFLAGFAARASDGVLEVNQTCAVLTGCHSFDSPGFPITLQKSTELINTPQSIRLVSDLVLSDTQVSAIVVLMSDVTIDLNGFRIISAACENASTDCRPSAIGAPGIRAQPTQFTEVESTTVRNGSIIGMGEHGVDLGRYAEVRNVNARWNGGSGILVGSGSIVTDNITFQNGLSTTFAGIGIESSLFSYAVSIRNNVSDRNQSSGVRTSRGSIVSGNIAHDNGSFGLSIGEGSVVVRNSAYDNSASGIGTGESVVVAENIAGDNGTTGFQTGITVDSGTTIQRNAVYRTSGRGISGNAVTNFRENTIVDNSNGDRSGGRNSGGNLCTDGTSCAP